MSQWGSPGAGWWQASDGQWYPPHLQPGQVVETPPQKKPRSKGVVIALVVGGLLLVVALLGVVAGVVVFAVGGVSDSASVRACEIEVKSVMTANEAAHSVSGRYSDGAGLVAAGFLRAVPPSAELGVSEDGQTVTVTPAGSCADMFEQFSHTAGENSSSAVDEAFGS